jgi:tRNA (guanosine-2'-O-)-methyltransferase
MPTERRIKKLKRVLEHRQKDLTVVCENIHDPHNVSAILRSCDAVGIDAVHLLYSQEGFPKLGKKSSASAKKWLGFQRHKDYNSLREELKSEQKMIYATYLDSNAISIFEIDWTLPSAIMVGNEHQGVSNEALEISDRLIYIPMFGMVESLNVSVATAVILYEACRQRIAAKGYMQSNHPDWVKEKLDEWLKT